MSDPLNVHSHSHQSHANDVYHHDNSNNIQNNQSPLISSQQTPNPTPSSVPDQAALTAFNQISSPTHAPTIPNGPSPTPMPVPGIPVPVPAATAASSTGVVPSTISPPVSPRPVPPSAVGPVVIPECPIPGLLLPLKAKPDGNGTDREWLELKRQTRTPATPAATTATAPTADGSSAGAASTPPICLDDGNMLIGLMGRDDHASAFMNNLSRTQPLRVISYKQAFIFPRAKSKRLTYEGYHPDGIVKTHWIVKHKYLIPAVVLLLIEWEDAKNYDTQEMNVCVRVAKLKAELQGRETKLIIVIIKQQRWSNNEEEAILIDRLTRGVKRVGLDSATYRTVCTLYLPELRASAKRLELLVFETASDYYRTQIRRLRNLKTRISRTSQLTLYCRHQLKVGYFSECVQDSLSAIKHYQNSYTALLTFVNNLSTPLLSSSIAHEIKQVALVLNYRLCRLFLAQQRWTDATQQFQLHINSLTKCVGLTDLLFNHSQWLSQQYHLFADLLESSTYAVQQQRSRQFNSGFYYQTAANYTMKRKQHAQYILNKLRSGQTNFPPLYQPSTLSPSPYLGQARLPYAIALQRDDRAIPGVMSFYVSQNVEDLVRAVISLESGVDHSSQIILFLNKSYESYRTENSGRMLVHVASQIATEYFSQKNWEMAQRFFDKIATTYRQEQWWMILTATLMTVYHCAQQLNKTQELILYGLELIGKYATTTTEQKEKIHINLIQVFQTAAASDPKKLAVLQQVFDIPLRYHLLDCSAFFLTTPASVVYVKQWIDMMVTLTIRFPLPVLCTSIQLYFNHSQYGLTLLPDGTEGTTTLPTEEGEDSLAATMHDAASTADPPILTADADNIIPVNTLFRPNRAKTFHLRFPAQTATNHPFSSPHNKADESDLTGLQLTHLITKVLLSSTLPPECALQMKSYVAKAEDEQVLKPVYGMSVVDATATTDKKKGKKKAKKDERTAEQKEEEERQKAEAEEAANRALSVKLATVSIVPPHPAAQLLLEHPAPALLNEYYPFTITIQSKQDDMNNATLHIQATAPSNEMEKHHLQNHTASTDQALANAAATHPEPKQDGQIVEHGRQEAEIPIARFYILSAPHMPHNTEIHATDLSDFPTSLSLPTLPAHSTHFLTVFACFSLPTLYHLTMLLSYENQEGFQLQQKEELSVSVKQPLGIKYKVFSDAVYGSQTHNHLHIDNLSPHPLALCDLGISLPHGVFQTSLPTLHPGSDHPSTQPLLTGTDRASQASAAFHSRHANNPMLLPQTPVHAEDTLTTAAASLSSVLLAPGERYLHLFYLIPLTRGRVLSSSLSVHWCRVSVHKKEKEMADFNGHMTERQREEWIKKLLEEQKRRAGGEEWLEPSTSSDALNAISNTLSKSALLTEEKEAPIHPQPESKPPVAVSLGSVNDVLQRELRHAEEEEKALSQEQRDLEEAEKDVQVAAAVNKPTAPSAHRKNSIRGSQDITQQQPPSAAVSNGGTLPQSPGAGDEDQESGGEEEDESSTNKGDAADSSAALISGENSEGILSPDDPHQHLTWMPVELKQSLPEFIISVPPMTVTMHYLHRVTLAEMFSMTVNVNNHTDKLQEIDYTLVDDPTNTIPTPTPTGPVNPTASPTAATQPKLLVGGIRAATIRVLPRSVHSIKFDLLPMETGFLNMPKMQLKSVTLNQVLDEPNEMGQVWVGTKEKKETD